jgi:YVTN family beta-propeller protein
MKISAFLKKDLWGKGISAPGRVNTRRRSYLGSRGRLTGLIALFLLALFGPGCGDYYRPVAIPIPVNSPNPAALHFMYSVASAGRLNVGSISQIDITGDALTGVVNTGQSPVHATLSPDGSRVYVANSGDDTVTVNSGAAQPTTINLAQICPQTNPCPLVPVFVDSTEIGRMYVADKGTGTISVINTASNAVVATVAVNPTFAGSPLPSPNPAAQPVALAEMPNGTKIYSVNQGDSTVTSINTLDDTIAARITKFFAPPIWAVASSDSAFIYVLDKSGTISVIDTLSDAVVSKAFAGAGANYIFYDAKSDRLYVTNPTASSVIVFDVSGNTLLAHTPIPISASASSACSVAAVSAGAAVPPALPTSITVLGDESRAYVASYQLYTASGVTSVCTQADVIDNGTRLVRKTIPLFQATDNSSQTGCSAARFRVFIAVSGGGTNTPFKVFVSLCDAGSIADIYTAAVTTGPNPSPADSFMAALPAPVSSTSSGQISVSDVSLAKFTTTYTYSPMTPTNLQVGSIVVITGLQNVVIQGVSYSVNGVFAVSSVSGNTFTVSSPNNLGTSTGSESGQTGNGTLLAVGNPVFLVPGP